MLICHHFFDEVHPHGCHVPPFQLFFAAYRCLDPFWMPSDRYSCEVQSQKSASTYHPSLTGTAKVLSCIQDAYQYSTDIYVYLEAYGMFVLFQYVTRNVQGEWTIEVVES